MARRSAWGSIQAAGPGIWRLRYPLPNDPSTGKRRQGYETVHGTKKDASKRLAELRIEHDRFRASPAVMTVSRLWGQHYSKHIERLAPSTVEGYESAYRTAIEPIFGSRELDSIRKAEVQEWLDGMTYGSAKKALAVLRAMFSFAVDNDMCNESPFTKRYQLPPKPQKSSREVSESVHTEAELAAILADARGERWEAPFILSAFGGLRREEAFGAQWGDIGFQDGYAVVRVQRGAQNAKGGVRIVKLKTEGSYREAVIPMPYAQRLREISFERLGDTWVCEGDDCEPLNPDLMSAAYKRWHFGKPHRYVPWMNLRNSYATMLHAKGVDLGTVAKLLGHATPTVTFQHYDRMSAEQLASVVSVLGNPSE